MHAYARAGLIALPLLVAGACAVETESFNPPPGSTNGTAGSGSGSTHAGGSPGTGSNSGAGGSGTGSGAGSGTAGGGGAPQTLDDACKVYASAACKKLNGCAPNTVTYQFGTESTCETRYELWCSIFAQSKLATNKRTSAWTPEGLAQCGATLSTLACTVYLELPESQGLSLCTSPAGKLTDGAICVDSSECASAYCKYAGGCGICAEKGDTGAVCDSSLDCKSTLVCSDATNPSSCQAPIEENQSCMNADTGCALGLNCVDNFCRTPSSDGYCDTNTACDERLTVVCDYDQNECLPIEFGKVGDACGDSVADAGSMYAGVECEALGVCPITDPATCSAGPKEGEACGIRPTRTCTFPSNCLRPPGGGAAICTLPDESTCM
jgi:hypothetical protein